MKRSIFLMIIVMITFAVSAGISAEPERHDSSESAIQKDQDRHEEREISGTMQATSLLKISYDRSMLPVEPEIIEMLISGSTVTARAARQLGFIPTGNEEYFHIRPDLIVTDTDDYLLFNLEVKIKDAEPVAEEFMYAVINNLRESLEITYHQHKMEFQQNLEHAMEKCMHAENELKEIQNHTREIASNAPVNRQDLQAMIQDLTHESRRIKMEAVSSEHIIKELSEQMLKARTGAEERLQTDPVSKELREMLASSENNLHLVEEQVKAGRHPAEVLEQAREKLMKTRIEMARRREDLIRQHGGDKAEQLAEKTTDMAMQMSQMKIRSEALLKELEETRRQLVYADEYEILSIKIQMAKEKLRHALEMKNRMELTDLQPPRVYVIGND